MRGGWELLEAIAGGRGTQAPRVLGQLRTSLGGVEARLTVHFHIHSLAQSSLCACA